MQENSIASTISLADRRRDQLDDDALVRLAQGGAAGAFEVLVRRHQARVLKICYRYLGDVASAQDAAQNTFVALYRYLPKYKPQGQFQPLLWRVSLNQCKMITRARKPPLVREEPPAPVEAPDAQILRSEQRRALQAALSKLPQRHRKVVALRFGGELSYQEIADILRIPIGTVRSRLSDGLAKLRRIMRGRA